MDEHLAMLIMDISAYSISIPLLIGWINLRNLNWEQRMLLILIYISIFFELAALLVGMIMEHNNLPLLHVFTVLQFLVLALIYRRKLHPLIDEKLISGTIVFFMLFALISAFIFDGLLRFNTYARALESVLLIFFALAFFYKTLQELKIKKLEREPMFWISTGVLIYFSGNLIIFIVCNYFFTSDEFLFIAWSIHAILNIVTNVFYAITLWIRPQT